MTVDAPPPPGLSNQLLKMCCTAFSGKEEYLPAGTHLALLNEGSVRSELELGDVDSDPDVASLVTFILTDVPRIFLMLIELGWSDELTLAFLRHFQRHNFTDASLPVNLDFCESNEAFAVPSVKKLLAMQHTFYKYQWRHLAPVFSGDNFMIRLEQDVPLPFTKLGSYGSGASSTVYKVKVHKDHLKNPPVDVSLNRGAAGTRRQVLTVFSPNMIGQRPSTGYCHQGDEGDGRPRRVPRAVRGRSEGAE